MGERLSWRRSEKPLTSPRRSSPTLWMTASPPVPLPVRTCPLRKVRPPSSPSRKKVRPPSRKKVRPPLPPRPPWSLPREIALKPKRKEQLQRLPTEPPEPPAPPRQKPKPPPRLLDLPRKKRLS